MPAPQVYQLHFDTSKLKNLRVGTEKLNSFTIRETDGADEEVAAQMAKGKGGSATTGEECVRLSIVEVNGVQVGQPYLAFDTWNSRARGFVLQAYRNLNGVTEEEVDVFLAGGKPVGGASDAPPATA